MTLKRAMNDVGLLLLRLGFAACLILGHGLQKWTILHTKPGAFPDPLGIGAVPSILSSMAAEVGASSLVALGLFTRLAALPVMFTMATVAIVVHVNDPWAATEPSVLYGMVYAAIFLLGPGRLSLDYLLRSKT